MTLQPSDLLAITRPAGPEAGTYQLPVAALAEQLGTPPVLGISGILWSTVRSAADNSWEAVCWSPELQLYVSVAGTGSGNRVMTSSDAIRWSPQAVADQNWVALCWAAELGLFVAVSNSGTGSRVMTSMDGRNWTLRQTPVDHSWTSICWAPELGLLVAVAGRGTGSPTPSTRTRAPVSSPPHGAPTRGPMAAHASIRWWQTRPCACG
jgi:hypothetical protein